MANVTYGEVTQVIGAVVDIRFKPGELPDLMRRYYYKVSRTGRRHESCG
jgi:F-type H+-transporting ATPase subunit beta